MIAMMRPRVAVADLRIAKPEDKQAAPHYATPEHKAWRAAVIARAGGTCQWPDCGRRERRMFADHIDEIQDAPGKKLEPENGQCLCGAHHTIKTNQARARRQAGGTCRPPD